MDPWIWWTLAVILVLLALSAFFSGSETALTAVNRASLHAMSAKGSRGAQAALRLTGDSERLIGSILLGNNLVNISAASLATSVFTTLFGESGVAWATLVMTFTVLIFSEVAPKTYAISNPDRTAVAVAPFVTVVVRVFAPVVGFIRTIVRLSFRVLGIVIDPDAHILDVHEQIKGQIDLHVSAGQVDRDSRDRLIAALDLKERDISEVMRHRRDIATISADAPTDEIVRFILESQYTRIPLWRGEPENIVGVVHAKDLLRAVEKHLRAHPGTPGTPGALDGLDIMSVAMAPWFVPDTRTLDSQLRAFLKRRSHFALVVDEYGALQGLVTLEDILEEIVGDIADEHDIQAEGISREPDGALLVAGTTTIRDLNRHAELALPDDEATTIAGLVIHEAQTIPTPGQTFVFHGMRFEVLERKRHQITRLRVKPLRR